MYFKDISCKISPDQVLLRRGGGEGDLIPSGLDTRGPPAEFCVRCGCGVVCTEGRVAAGRICSRTAASPGRDPGRSGPETDHRRVIRGTSIYLLWRLSSPLISCLWSEVERGQDVLVLRPRCPPRVVQLETLIAEIGPAVGAALCGLQRLGRLAKLAHHSHAAQADRVPIPVKAG